MAQTTESKLYSSKGKAGTRGSAAPLVPLSPKFRAMRQLFKQLLSLGVAVPLVPPLPSEGA